MFEYQHMSPNYCFFSGAPKGLDSQFEFHETISFPRFLGSSHFTLGRNIAFSDLSKALIVLRTYMNKVGNKRVLFEISDSTTGMEEILEKMPSKISLFLKYSSHLSKRSMSLSYVFPTSELISTPPPHNH